MRQRIRDDLLDVGRMSRYYTVIADRQRKWYLWLSTLTIMGSIGAATLLLLEWMTPISIGLFFVVATVSTIMVVFDFSRRAQIALTAATQLREIEVDLIRLWHKDRHGDGKDMVRELELFERRIDSATRDDLPLDEELNKRCSLDANKTLDSFYGSEAGYGETAPTTASTGPST